MRASDPFGFVGAINFPKDKKTVDKVHKVLFKNKNLEKNEKKMRKFVNDIGCKAEFEESISEPQVKERLSWLGKNWREVK